MKIGQKILTLAAMTAFSVGTIHAQGTIPKPGRASGQPMTSKMASDQTTQTQSDKKKAGKPAHGHHHNKSKKHASTTPTQETAPKK